MISEIMINNFYEIVEMLCSSLFVLILIKMFHLVTLLVINFKKIDSMFKDDKNVKN